MEAERARVRCDGGVCVLVLVPAFALAFALASCGPLRPKSDAWRPDVGAGLADSFRPGFVPPSQFYYAYATPTRPGRVYVSPSHRSVGSVAYSWAPAGLPVGRYVFEIDPGARAINHVAWDVFASLDIETGYRPMKSLGDFASIHPRGTLEALRSVCPFGETSPGWLAVLSFDDTTTVRREIGMPSVIPFMGRQDIVERVEYHGGTAYLEIFDVREPQPEAPAPVFRMSKVYSNWHYLPELGELGGWVIGSDRPVLVVVDAAASAPASPVRTGEIVVVSLPAK